MKLTHDYYTIPEACKVTGLKPGSAYEYCSSGKLPGATMFRGKWLIPKEGLACLVQEGQDERLKKEYPVQKGQDRRLEKEYPVYKITGALKRLELIRKFSSLKDKFARQTGSAQRANSLASEAVGVPMRTMRRWLSKYDRLGLRGLIDRRGIKKQ